MASAYLVKKQTAAGPSWHVRYRLTGRGSPIRHAGAFHTKKEATVRLQFIRDELAAGRDPRVTLEQRTKPVEKPPTMRDWWHRFERAREVDVAPSTHRTYAKRWAHLAPTLGDVPVAEVTVDHLQEIVNKLDTDGRAAGYIGNIVNLAQMILDEAGVEPNPARSKRLRTPKVKTEIPIIATGQEIETMMLAVSKKYGLLIRLLERTGMRVGEVADLEWQDIDERNSRIRVRKGKTPRARRWVIVPHDVMADVADLCPREDRVPERLVFQPRRHPNSVGSAMTSACKASGIAHYTPHDLRHRYASIMAKLGVPRTDLIRQLGHSKPSELDTYEHTIVDLTDVELEVWQPIAARLSGRMVEPTREEVEA